MEQYIALEIVLYEKMPNPHAIKGALSVLLPTIANGSVIRFGYDGKHFLFKPAWNAPYSVTFSLSQRTQNG